MLGPTYHITENGKRGKPQSSSGPVIRTSPQCAQYCQVVANHTIAGAQARALCRHNFQFRNLNLRFHTTIPQATNPSAHRTNLKAKICPRASTCKLQHITVRWMPPSGQPACQRTPKTFRAAFKGRGCLTIQHKVASPNRTPDAQQSPDQVIYTQKAYTCIQYIVNTTWLPVLQSKACDIK